MSRYVYYKFSFFSRFGILIFITEYLKTKRCADEAPVIIVDLSREIFWGIENADQKADMVFTQNSICFNRNTCGLLL